MPRSNIKYELASNEEDYYLQNIQEFQNLPQNSSFYKKMIQTICLILVYFVLSIGLTFYQKWLYATNNFKFPLGVVMCHLIFKFMLAASLRHVRKCFKSQQQVRISWQSVIYALGPPGIASGLDIGLSNWAMSLITLSLYTMTKSTTIIFILGFALIFKLEKKSWSLMGIVVMISGGLMMFTYKSTQFNLLGFLLCLLASLCSGVRWTMAQMIMQKSKLGLRNPIDMMYYMQPWMMLSLLPIVSWFEGYSAYNQLRQVDWSNFGPVIEITCAIVGGAVLAFSMEVMEFLVVTYSSSLTLSISGIFKEICILVLAYEWKGDRMSGLNFIGLLMCLGGIILHVIQKFMINKSESAGDLELERSNSIVTTFSKSDELVDANFPLITQKSSSLTNLLNATFSSDEEEEFVVENSSQILSNILQRRE